MQKRGLIVCLVFSILLISCVSAFSFSDFFDNLFNGKITGNAVRGGCPSDLVAYYTFEGQANDQSGNGDHGTGNVLNFVSGKIGRAADFNGVNNYINLAYGNLRLGNSHTLSGWIYLKSNVSASIVAKWCGICGYNGLRDARSYNVGFSNGKLDYGISTAGGQLSSTFHTFNSNSALPLNQWVFFAVTYNGTRRTIYLNGVEDAHVDRPGDIYQSYADVQIGAALDSGYRAFFNGSIDELAFFNRALSASEISDLYNNGNGKDVCSSVPECTEGNWNYTLSPSTCPLSGQQTKTWTKTGTCTGGVSHPSSENVSCTYVPPAPTCNDGIMNGNETGIDCGGTICPVCTAIPTEYVLGQNITLEQGPTIRISTGGTNSREVYNVSVRSITQDGGIIYASLRINNLNLPSRSSSSEYYLENDTLKIISIFKSSRADVPSSVFFRIEGSTQNTNCIDSDGGLNYYVQGYLNSSVSLGTNFEDYCLSNITLLERYCTSDPSMFTKLYNCSDEGKVCSNGVCVSRNTSQIYALCLIRDAYTSAPAMNALNVGAGYAKYNLGYVNDYQEAVQGCTDSIYNGLMSSYCSSNSKPGQWGIVTYNSTTGDSITSGCASSGCSYLSCPILPNCTDNELGVSYYVSGNVRYNGQDYPDSCSGNLLTEYSCFNNAIFNYPAYDCSLEGKICSNGACVANGSIGTKTCAGCEYENKCLPVGYRIIINEIPSYCDIYGIAPQKVNEENLTQSCQNSYECESNICSSGQCVELEGLKAAFVKILCRLTTIFSTEPDAYEKCVAEYVYGACVSSWNCTDWSVCANGQQNRTCNDIKNCSTPNNTPSLKQNCSVIDVSNCSDSDGGLDYYSKGTVQGFNQHAEKLFERGINPELSDGLIVNSLTSATLKLNSEQKDVIKGESYLFMGQVYIVSDINYISENNTDNYLSLTLTEANDVCVGNNLVEGICEGNEFSQIDHVCPNGCLDGACINVSGSVCGNNITETGEECDDGNMINGDGCSDTCTNETILPICGNGVVQSGEDCDGADWVGDSCIGLNDSFGEPYVAGNLSCNNSCGIGAEGCYTQKDIDYLLSLAGKGELSYLYSTNNKEATSDLSEWTLVDSGFNYGVERQDNLAGSQSILTGNLINSRNAITGFDISGGADCSQYNGHLPDGTYGPPLSDLTKGPLPVKLTDAEKATAGAMALVPFVGPANAANYVINKFAEHAKEVTLSALTEMTKKLDTVAEKACDGKSLGKCVLDKNTIAPAIWTVGHDTTDTEEKSCEKDTKSFGPVTVSGSGKDKDTCVANVMIALAKQQEKLFAQAIGQIRGKWCRNEKCNYKVYVYPSYSSPTLVGDLYEMTASIRIAVKCGQTPFTMFGDRDAFVNASSDYTCKAKVCPSSSGGTSGVSGSAVSGESPCAGLSAGDACTDEEGNSGVCDENCQCTVCGNNLVDTGEDCDGTDLNSKTCADVAGADSEGTLACGADCTFDTSGCGYSGCGDKTCPDNSIPSPPSCDCPPTTCSNGCPDWYAPSCDCQKGYCGDGVCGSGEDYNNCPEDCTPTAICGDGSCNNGETCYTCSLDCGQPGPYGCEGSNTGFMASVSNVISNVGEAIGNFFSSIGCSLFGRC